MIRTLTIVLLVLLLLSFVGIDAAHLLGFIKAFPVFLFMENLVYAAISLILIYLLLENKDAWPWVTFFGAYLTGRVSRSVITPYGTFPKLAAQHVPLLLLSLLLGVLGLIGCFKRKQ